jgi:hypothetical protein
MDFVDQTDEGARRRITVMSDDALRAEHKRTLDGTEAAALKALIDRTLQHFKMKKADVVDHSCSDKCPCFALPIRRNGKLDRSAARKFVENARRERGLSLKKASALIHLFYRSAKVRALRSESASTDDPLTEALFQKSLAFMLPVYVDPPLARKGFPTAAFHPRAVKLIAEWLTDSIVEARTVTGTRMVSKANRDELMRLLSTALSEIAGGSNHTFIEWFRLGCGIRIVDAIDTYKTISNGSAFCAQEGTTELRVRHKLDPRSTEGSRAAEPHEILEALLDDCAQEAANREAAPNAKP